MVSKLTAASCGVCLLLFSSFLQASNKKNQRVNTASENLSSEYNYDYSATRPTKERFIDLVNRNRGKVSNSTIERAYSEPMITPTNALIYAMAMDYTLGDGSKEVFMAYRTAAYAGADFLGHRGYLEYADFLIRTKRYDVLIDHFEPSICYQYRTQCIYYKVAAKFLRDGECDIANYKEAYKFKLMSGVVSQICSEK